MLPLAVKCGLSEKEYLHMTPRAVRTHIEGFYNRRKNEWEKEEYNSWLSGYFNMYAIGANMSKKVKYPDNPLNKEKAITDISEMDEEEIAKVHEDYLNKLDLIARTAFGKKE